MNSKDPFSVFAKAFQDCNFDPVDYDRPYCFKTLDSIQIPKFSDENISVRALDTSNIPLIGDLNSYATKNIIKYYEGIEKHKLNKQVDHYLNNL